MLSKLPSCRLGYLYAEKQLWGQHGFDSKRLPASSAAAAQAALRAAQRAARRGTAGWEDEARSAMQASFDAYDPSSIWHLGRLLYDGMNSRLHAAEQGPAAMLGGHAASAAAALVIAVLPLAGGLAGGRPGRQAWVHRWLR